MRKIPRLDLAYWLLLISATVFGETGGDLVSTTLNLGYLISAAIFLALFGFAVAFQLTAKAEHPAYYWAVILTTSVAGTPIADFVTRSMGLGYGGGSLLMLCALGMVFAVWRMGGHALNDDGAPPLGAETLYWTGILAASCLGTSFGDWLAHDAGLGFAGGSLLLGVLLLAIALLQRLVADQKELFYWAAIIAVHPIGATAGDYLSQPAGLNLGPVLASALLGLGFVTVFLLTTFVQRRVHGLRPAFRSLDK